MRRAMSRLRRLSRPTSVYDECPRLVEIGSPTAGRVSKGHSAVSGGGRKAPEAHDQQPAQRRAPTAEADAPERSPGAPPVAAEAPALSDSRLTPPANIARRAQLLLGLQRTAGNAYVQRLVRQRTTGSSAGAGTRPTGSSVGAAD